MAKKLYGSYNNNADAQDVVLDLIDQGCPADSIVVLSNDPLALDFADSDVVVESVTYDKSDESLWERFKGFFRGDDTVGDPLLTQYRNDLDGGSVLVLIEEDYFPIYTETRDTVQDIDTATAPGTFQMDRTAESTLADDGVVRLEEERLSVDKDSVQAGEVKIHKRVVEKNETINVPVRHEELVVEKTAVTDYQAGTDDFGEEVYTIPLMEEQVHVTKEPVVTEEYHIRKRSVEDTRQVSDTVRKEELDFEKTGDVYVQGMDGADTGTTDRV